MEYEETNKIADSQARNGK